MAVARSPTRSFMKLFQEGVGASLLGFEPTG
jgi:hypothetical protein